MNFTTLHPPLIADPDPQFLLKLAEDNGASLSPPVTVTTCKALEDQLDHGRYVFSGIFVNLAIAGKDTVKILTKIRRTRPSTPIFLICDESASHPEPISREFLKSLTVHEQVFKPLTYMQVLKRANSAQMPEAQHIQHMEEAPVSGKVEIAGNDNEYLPVLTSQFLAGSPSHFGLYIRLSEKRFIKILRRGDTLGHDRLEFYRKKAIEQFYIQRNEYEGFLDYCSENLQEILNNPKIGAREKTRLTLQHGQQVMAFLQSRKIAPQMLRHAQEFVNSVHKLTDHLKLDEISDIKSQLQDPAFRDHASASTLISAILSHRLGLRGEKMTSLVGTASFLHDIGLPHPTTQKFLDGDLEAMSEEELTIYFEHPKRGAEMLKKLGRLEPLAIQAIAQHHERRDRKGFPGQLGAGQINLISEVVGISDEFMQQVSLSSKHGNLDPIRQMEEHCFNGFSASVIDAFRKCFG
ncbi:MAG: HD-GYP domain-containing protein [Bdellovibrionia bacterium]